MADELINTFCVVGYQSAKSSQLEIWKKKNDTANKLSDSFVAC